METSDISKAEHGAVTEEGRSGLATGPKPTKLGESFSLSNAKCCF